MFQSVVSGSSDPDSITLSRAWDDQLSIVKKVIGRKETQITVQGVYLKPYNHCTHEYRNREKGSYDIHFQLLNSKY